MQLAIIESICGNNFINTAIDATENFSTKLAVNEPTKHRSMDGIAIHADYHDIWCTSPVYWHTSTVFVHF